MIRMDYNLKSYIVKLSTLTASQEHHATRVQRYSYPVHNPWFMGFSLKSEEVIASAIQAFQVSMVLIAQTLNCF